jgi:signal transduction histidine kinase/CheY-like chemotaxis protein
MAQRDAPTVAGARGTIDQSIEEIGADALAVLLPVLGGVLWLATLASRSATQDGWPAWALPLLLLLLVGLCYLLKDQSYRLASRLLVLGLAAGAGAAVVGGADEAALLLYVPVVLLAGTLCGTRAAVAVAALATAVLLASRSVGAASPGPGALFRVLAAVWLTALVSGLTGRSQRTALSWLWESQEEATANLAEARRHRGELASALDQLAAATYRLERANHALAWARQEADKARQAKAQFAAHVSHELRTPLNLIVGFAELILNSPGARSGARISKAFLADLTALHRSARHLQGMIDDILDLSQLDAGEMPLFRETADVGAMVQEAVTTARPLLERKGLAVDVVAADGLPPLYVDRLRIRQVLLNLLNNAARFTDHGAVTVQAFRDQGEVVLEVSDTGAGIEPTDLDRLFEPFHQLDPSATRGHGGTGLGLAISRRFVGLHGGRVWARSEGKGRGSTFGFSLPVHPNGTPWPEGPDGPPLPARGIALSPPEPTVVLLDDDPAVLGLFRRHLEGFRVVGAPTPAAALERAAASRAHALITDLPAGEQLATWQERWSGAPARDVRVLGCPMPSGRRVALALGLADYLVKPVTREALQRSVAAAAPSASRVLVIDDEPQMVRLLSRMLQSSGRTYRLLRAYDGAHGLELARRHRPDLVILDLLMPDLDGLSLLERLKEDPELTGLPVVAVSARGPVEAITASSSRTVALVNDRPFPVSQLLRTVQVLLDALPPKEADAATGQPPRAELVGSAAS